MDEALTDTSPDQRLMDGAAHAALPLAGELICLLSLGAAQTPLRGEAAEV